MAASDDPRPSETEDSLAAGAEAEAAAEGEAEAEAEAEAPGQVEEMRRTLARGGRPRVGRRFDAVMRKARMTRPAARQVPGAQERAPAEQPPREDRLARWSSDAEQAPAPPIADPLVPDPPENPVPEEPDPTISPTPEPGPAGETPATPERQATAADQQPAAPPTVPKVPSTEATGDPVLRADELAASRGAPQPSAGISGARGTALGVPWPPAPRLLLLIALVTLTAFTVGALTGASLRAAPDQAASPPTQPAPTSAAAAPTSAPAAASPTTSPLRAPQACLDTARLGDQTISLLTANVRDRRLDDALLRYATASRRCRQAASPSR